MWRAEDEALLERLEDEELLERLFAYHTLRAAAGAGLSALHPRAAGLVACVRDLPEGAAAVRAALSGDVTPLARVLDAPPMRERPPALLHHVALYFGKVAACLEATAPEAAANAWVRALSAWFGLAEEREYLERLTGRMLGADAPKARAAGALRAEDMPAELVRDLGRRAERAARELAPAGRAALLALAWIGDAERLAGTSPETSRAARREAERARSAVVDIALSSTAEALEDAHVRGELGSAGGALLARVADVWRWSGQDECAEHFAVEKVAAIGWELYRARKWDALRQLLGPMRPLIDALASRVETDPSAIAYAASCAQMFVFLAEVESGGLARKLELAERAVRLCPTHRNGRLVLAGLLCDEAIDAMRRMMLFVRRDELERVEARITRAEQLYPQASELAEAKALLDQMKRGRIAI